jgi:lysophospholipid acyltransferase (LPLAT)-like uncharacterized protein
MSARMTAIALSGAAVIRLLGLSWRFAWAHTERLDDARRLHPNVIFASWHGRLLPLSYSHRSQAIHVLASEHRDGEMLGQTIRLLGFGHVRGSSTRGGARAILELRTKLASGYDVAFTVDGPKGPRGVVKPGPAQVAKLSGAAIVPITTSSRRHKTLRSWDAFEIPAPFTRVRIMYGRPVVVPRDADDATIESKRVELERELTAITEENDRAVAR